MIEYTHWTEKGWKLFSESLEAANNIIRRKMEVAGKEKIKTEERKEEKPKI